jgi:hypothetical protein
LAQNDLVVVKTSSETQAFCDALATFPGAGSAQRCEMLERQVFVLRVWRDPHGELRASLKSAEDQVSHFANLESVVAFLKTRFEASETQPETRRKS